MPQSASVYWSPHGHLPKLETWAASRPVLLYGWGISLSTQTRVYGNVIYDALLTDRTQNIGNILVPVGVDYILFHNDTLDHQSYQELYQNLLKQNLEVSFANKDITIFENKIKSSLFRTTDKLILVEGGLDALLDLSDLGIDVSSAAYVFTEQLASGPSLKALLSLQDIEKVLIFQGAKNIDDLVLSTIPEKYYLAPARLVKETYPRSQWQKYDIYSHLWIPEFLHLFDEKPGYDFDLGKGFLLTEQNEAEATFGFQVARSDLYEVWVRTMFSPKSGIISGSVDDEKFNLALDSNRQATMKWIKIMEADLISGEHKINLKSNSGINSINVIAVVPKETLAYHRQELYKLIEEHDVKLVHLFRAQDFAPLTQKSSNNEIVINMLFPNFSQYTIALRTNTAVDTSKVTANINEQLFFIKDKDDKRGWYFIGPVKSSESTLRINLSNVDYKDIDGIAVYEEKKQFVKLDELLQGAMLPYVITSLKTGVTTFDLQIDARRPFILMFSESYHNGWQVDANNFHFPAFSAVNGFYVSSTGHYSLQLDFIPQRYFQLGIIITILTVTISVISVWLLTDHRFLHKAGRRLSKFLN